ncbi:hypothetical protein [Lactococcus fujiensis]|uniref:hypothetical protein n=1 Tax=Lactococcus fujiensis TaxID=610251 RepID=UPI0006D08580|nr:hypothetical protein [Lactococcus fujiensis]
MANNAEFIASVADLTTPIAVFKVVNALDIEITTPAILRAAKTAPKAIITVLNASTSVPPFLNQSIKSSTPFVTFF